MWPVPGESPDPLLSARRGRRFTARASAGALARAAAGRSLALGATIGLCIAAGLLTGCAARTPVAAPLLSVEPLPPLGPVEYRLQAGDLIAVRFWGSQELDEEVRVRPDGRVSLPFVDDIGAAGRTPAELDALLESHYASELRDPHITVIVREASPPRAFIGGEVGIQGAVELAESTTLFQAIQQAGGFTTTARRRQVVLIRSFPDGARQARAIDLRPVLSGAAPERDPRLAQGDIVFVPRTRIENVNLFVDQYIDDIVPLQNVFGGLLLGNIADDSNDDPAPVVVPPAEGDS